MERTSNSISSIDNTVIKQIPGGEILLKTETFLFEKKSKHPAIILFNFLLAVMLLNNTGEATSELNGSVVIGYDSFMDRFTILERDTMETIHDFHTGFNGTFLMRRENINATLHSYFKYGNQTVDGNLNSDLSIALSPSTKLDIRGNFHWQHFQDFSDYTYGNDYIQSNGSVRIKRKVSDNSRITLKSRFELTDYDKRTDFDYDYYYYDTGIEFSSGSYMNNFISIGFSYGYRQAPDTTNLNFRRSIVTTDIQLSPGDDLSYNLGIFGDRHNYRTDIRSSYWHWFSYSTLKKSGEKISYSLNLDTEFIQYDTRTETYFDTRFVRLGFKPEYEITPTVSIFIEPRLGGLQCPDYSEEEYLEMSSIAGIDMMRRSGFWLTFSVEPGYRKYLEKDNTLYSDFFLIRISMMGSISLPYSSELSTFISHDPEYHQRRDDNFSITMVSVGLSKSF